MAESSSGRRYVIIGGGAVGGALAAQFVPAGIPVVLVARGEHGKRIAADGLVVRRPTGVDVIDVPVAARPEDVRLRLGDVLVLTVKTQDVEAALNDWAWRPVYGENGVDAGIASGAEAGTGAADGTDSGAEVGVAAALVPIVTYQNGLATEDLALRRFARVYGATIAISASYLNPGEIVSPSLDPAALVWLGRHAAAPDQLQEELVADLNCSGIAGISVPDIGAYKAAKLLGNLSQNGLDLLSGDDELRGQARTQLREEARRVFVAAGVALLPGETLDFSGHDFSIQPVEGHVGGRLSTWQSFARGSSSEIDYLNGEVVLLARRHGLDAPLNERLQQLLGAEHLSERRTLEHLLSFVNAR